MPHAGDKVIPITNVNDKRQITAVLAASMAGKYFNLLLVTKIIVIYLVCSRVSPTTADLPGQDK